MSSYLSVSQQKPWIKALDRIGTRLMRSRRNGASQKISPSKLLFICLDDIIEVIRLLPFLQLLGETFSDVKYDFLVGDWSRPIVENHPIVDNVIGYNAPWLMQNMHSPELPSTQGFFNLAWEIRRRQYDTVVCARPDFRLNVLAALTGAPVRVGYGAAGGGFLLTHELPWESQKTNIKMYMDFAPLFNVKPYFIAPRIVPCEDDVSSAKSMMNGLSSSYPVAVIYPGGSQPELTWAPDRYSALITGLNELDIQVLLLGGPGKTDLINEITKDYAGVLLQIWNFPSYGEVAALAGMIDIYIGTVSGTSQIMAAAGAHSVVLTRVSNLRATGFIGLKMEPISPLSCCKKCRQPSSEPSMDECDCMSHITVDQVMKACSRLKKL